MLLPEERLPAATRARTIMPLPRPSPGDAHAPSIGAFTALTSGRPGSRDVPFGAVRQRGRDLRSPSDIGWVQGRPGMTEPLTTARLRYLCQAARVAAARRYRAGRAPDYAGSRAACRDPVPSRAVGFANVPDRRMRATARACEREGGVGPFWALIGQLECFVAATSRGRHASIYDRPRKLTRHDRIDFCHFHLPPGTS